MRLKLLIPPLVLILCLSCLSSLPKVVIPKADIIYQVVSNSDQDDHLSSQVGFINADGTGKAFVQLDKTFEVLRPFMSNAADDIYYLTPFEPSIDAGGRSIQILSADGTYNTCHTMEEDYNYNGFVFPVSFQGKSDLLISTSVRIEIVNYDSGDCSVIKTLVQVPDPNHDFILSASPANKSDLIIYSESIDSSSSESVNVVRTLNLQTGAEKKILDGGWNLTFSPDDQKIAYDSYGGIYVANADGAEPKQLVSYYVPNPFVENGKSWSAYPFWSPDGKWLVYDKCADDCQSPLDFAIYKVNVDSGVEEKITDMGLFPVWIK